MKYLIIWVVLVAVILIFNYSSHKRIQWLNNPFNDVINAAYRIDKRLKCKIQITPNLFNQIGAYGVTRFYDDGDIIIEIDANEPYINLIPILMHELAHVVAGRKAYHNEEWQLAFNNIMEEYEKIVKE